MTSLSGTPSVDRESDVQTTALVANALSSAADLAKAELALAVREIEEQAERSVAAIGLVASALGFSVFAATAVVGALLLLIGFSTVATLFATAIVLAACATALGLYARKVFPKDFLKVTRRRVASDLRRIEEHAP